jgi:hypothetical protein
MGGRLTYRDERLKGSDPINDELGLFLNVLSGIWEQLGFEIAFDLLIGLLEFLSG